MAAAVVAVAMLGACADEAIDDPEPAPSGSIAEPSESAGADEPAVGRESPSEAPVDDAESPADAETPAEGGTAPDTPDGWQTVEYNGSSFSVPESWDVPSEESDGQEVPRPTYGKGFCQDAPDEVLGFATLTWAEGVTDPAEAVTTEVERAAEMLFSDRASELQLGDVRQSESWASVPATLQLAPSDDPCEGSEALVIAMGFAYEDGSGTGLLIVVGELGLPDSPTPEDLVEIANSFG
ncbi:hypothetical protein [Ruania zhangjianzhongii]|uniref:hypothetical protein n=1 Tax=Ruania zhangjianzhongii TaxID=2603206 RepID=UPI0011D2AED4|nr:hypothetical protein [Ruania zhangjianzhongii]